MPTSKQTRILVTGGSGLLGHAIEQVAGTLPSSSIDWLFLSSKQCDLTDFDATYQLFETYQPTHVIHLAANVGGLFKNMRCPVEMLETNLAINTNTLKCSHLFGVERLVACLSTCVFPDDTTYPLDEDMLHQGPPHRSNAAYAHAKRILEVQCRAYRTQYGMNCVCVIPTNLYGPHDNFDPEDGHVIAGLIYKSALAHTQGTPLIVAGTGDPLRQFLYSADAAELIVWALLEYQDSKSLILTVDKEDEVSIGEVSHMIACATNCKGVIYDSTLSDGQHKKTASNARLRSHLPNFVFTPLKEGIEKTVKWYDRKGNEKQ